MPRPLALVTGSSGGIGLELARVLAADRHDLVLVARSADLLERAASDLSIAHGVDVEVIVADLSDRVAPATVAGAVGARRLGVLVNNAGYATWGRFAELDRDRELAMIDVNVRALTELTHRFLPGMLERGAGRILNLASTAAFFSGPLMATYYATKNYVLAFSEAVAEEVAGSGVTVTALCPGPTRSGFQARAGMEDSRLVKGRSLMAADAIARAGWDGAKAGRRVVIPGRRNRAHVLAPRLVPRRLLARSVMTAQRASH